MLAGPTVTLSAALWLVPTRLVEDRPVVITYLPAAVAKHKAMAGPPAEDKGEGRGEADSSGSEFHRAKIPEYSLFYSNDRCMYCT